MSHPPGVFYRTDVDPPAGPWVTPHVRSLAEARGIDLATVAGHGVGGRIRATDLPPATPDAADAVDAPPRAGAEAALHPPGEPGTADAARSVFADAARSVFAVEADVTALGAGPYLPSLLKAVVDARELADYPIATRVDGRLVSLPGVRDLNEDGIVRALADPASAKVNPARTLLVVEVPAALLAAPAVPGWLGPILAIGAAARRPAVVRTRDGGEGLAIRTIAQLTLGVDPLVVDDATATAFLRGLAARLS